MKAVYSPTAFLEYISVNLYGAIIYIIAPKSATIFLFEILSKNSYIVIPERNTVINVNILRPTIDELQKNENIIGM